MDKFDLLLQKHPISTPVRKTLTQDTIEKMKQVKLTRFARRLLAGLFVISLCFLIGKWINNDIAYLIQLFISKFALIKNQSTLYWSALFESFPKEQLFSILLAGILWICWRKFETYLLHTRITNKMIRLTPRLVFITGFIALMGIGFAGYSYAQKTEQKQLQILKEHINQSGRIELVTNISANQCNVSENKNLTNQFELKKNTNLTPDEAKNVIEAACNEVETKKFLIRTFHLGDPDKGVDGIEESATSEITTSMVSQIIEKTNNTIILKDAVMQPYTSTPLTISLNSETRVYKDNVLVPQNSLKEKDMVVALTRNRYSDSAFGHPSGDVTNRTVLGIYILPNTPEFKWYSLNFQHMVTQIETCPGNPEDRCTFTGSVDFFPVTESESDSTVNPDFTQAPHGMQKEISGKLVDIHETFVKIKTSSGRLFTLQFGKNVVDEFNQKKAPYYNATIGDTLLITYFEQSDQQATTLHNNQIINAVLMLEVVNKFDPIKKY